MSNTKQQLVRLGYSQPELRPHLRSVLAHLDRQKIAIDNAFIDELEHERSDLADLLKRRGSADHVILSRAGRADIAVSSGSMDEYEFDITLGHGKDDRGLPRKGRLFVSVEVEDGDVVGGWISGVGQKSRINGTSLSQIMSDVRDMALRLTREFVNQSE